MINRMKEWRVIEVYSMSGGAPDDYDWDGNSFDTRAEARDYANELDSKGRNGMRIESQNYMWNDETMDATDHEGWE